MNETSFCNTDDPTQLIFNVNIFIFLINKVYYPVFFIIHLKKFKSLLQVVVILVTVAVLALGLTQNSMKI